MLPGPKCLGTSFLPPPYHSSHTTHSDYFSLRIYLKSAHSPPSPCRQLSADQPSGFPSSQSLSGPSGAPLQFFPLLTGCVSLGKFLNLSAPECDLHKNRNFGLTFSCLLPSLPEASGLTRERLKLWLLFPASRKPYRRARQALEFQSANGEPLH